MITGGGRGRRRAASPGALALGAIVLALVALPVSLGNAPSEDTSSARASVVAAELGRTPEFRIPAHGAASDPRAVVTAFGFGPGDALDAALAPADPNAADLGEVRNQLAMNAAVLGDAARFRLRVGERRAESPEGLPGSRPDLHRFLKLLPVEDPHHISTHELGREELVSATGVGGEGYQHSSEPGSAWPAGASRSGGRPDWQAPTVLGTVGALAWITGLWWRHRRRTRAAGSSSKALPPGAPTALSRDGTPKDMFAGGDSHVYRQGEEGRQHLYI